MLFPILSHPPLLILPLSLAPLIFLSLRPCALPPFHSRLNGHVHQRGWAPVRAVAAVLGGGGHQGLTFGGGLRRKVWWGESCNALSPYLTISPPPPLLRPITKRLPSHHLPLPFRRRWGGAGHPQGSMSTGASIFLCLRRVPVLTKRGFSTGCMETTCATGHSLTRHFPFLPLLQPFPHSQCRKCRQGCLLRTPFRRSRFGRLQSEQIARLQNYLV